MFSSSQLAKTLRSMDAENGAEKTAERFLAFVDRYNLWNLVPAVLSNLEGSAQLRDASETLKIRVPQEASEETIEKIRDIAGASKTTKTEVEIDKSVLGGFVANYKGFEHEGSFERVVNNLEKSLKA